MSFVANVPYVANVSKVLFCLSCKKSLTLSLRHSLFLSHPLKSKDK